VEVWPENADTAAVFFALETQWAHNDFNGTRRGLRYEAITELFLDCQGVASDERGRVFQGLRVMERAALGTWAALRR